MNEIDEVTARWRDSSLCDICGGKCDNMTDENGHVGPYDFAITYCLHHTNEELIALYMKIKRANDKRIYKLVDEVLANNDVNQLEMDKAKSALAHMKYMNTALRKYDKRTLPPKAEGFLSKVFQGLIRRTIK